MTGEQLWASILQEAISGRLVPQLDSEPEVEQIGERPKDVPFEIPKKWKYVYLKYLTKLFSGTSYNKSDIQASGVRIIRGGNVKNFKVSLLDDDVYVKEELFNRSKVVRPSDIVIVASTGSYEVIGNPGEYTGTETVQIGAFLRIIRPIFRDYSEYLKVVFQSQYYRNHIRSLSKGTNIKNIKGDYIYLFPVPLPPLQEQQRIVDRLNELKPLVDEYGAAHKELVEIESVLPERLKASLIQEAISGKLVPQLDSEPEVEQIGETPKDVPFEIPKKWKWVYFDKLSTILAGRDLKKEFILSSNAEYGYFTGASNISRDGNIVIDRWTNSAEVESNRGDIIITCKGTVGKSSINTYGKLHIARQGMNIIINTQMIIQQFTKTYLEYIEDDLRENKAHGIIPGITKSDLIKMWFPLPPLPEQQRIVDRLNELNIIIKKIF